MEKEIKPEEEETEQDYLSRINRCWNCQKSTEYHYCEVCSKIMECAHGNILADGCNACDVEGDFAYDAERECK